MEHTKSKQMSIVPCLCIANEIKNENPNYIFLQVRSPCDHSKGGRPGTPSTISETRVRIPTRTPCSDDDCRLWLCQALVKGLHDLVVDRGCDLLRHVHNTILKNLVWEHIDLIAQSSVLLVVTDRARRHW